MDLIPEEPQVSIQEPVLELPPPEPPEPAEMDRDEARRRFSRIGFALLAVVAVQQLGSMAVAALTAGPAWRDSAWRPVLASILPLYLVGLPVFLLILRGQRPMPRPGEKRRVPGKLLAQLIFAGYAAVLLSNVVIVLGLYPLLGALKGGRVANPVASLVLGGNPWAVLPFAVVIGPMVEEYVFRGVLLKHLGAFGAKPYLLFSALTFALFHANLAQMPYAFALGLILAGLTYYSGTIKYAVIAHMAVNFVGSALPTLLLRLVGDAATLAIGVEVAVLAGAGIASVILLLRKRERLANALEPAAVTLPRGVMARNAGVVAFIAVLAALTVVLLVV